MSNIEVARASLREVEDKMKAIHRNAGERALTSSEQGRWDRLDHERAELQDAVDAITAEAIRKDENAERRAKWGSMKVGGYDSAPGGSSRTNPWAGLSDDIRGESATGYVTRALDALAATETIPTENRNRLAEMVQTDDTPASAMFIVAASDPAYRDAFCTILKDPVRGHLTWTEQERAAYARVESMRTALSLVDGHGGFLAPLVMDPNAILTNVGSTNPFRRISRIATTTSENYNATTTPGVTAEWLAEGAEAADGNPTFGRVTITPAKLAAYLFGSYEVLADTNLVEQIPRLIADAFDNAEATAHATGATSPKGVVTAVAAVTTSRVAPTTAGTFTTASIADLYKVHDALTSRARNSRSLSWVANNSTISLIRQMDDSGGSSFWANLNDGTPPRLLGAPIFESSAMSAAVTTGSNILLASSFEDYCIVDRIGVTLLYQPMLMGTTNGRPTGQAGWFAYKRTSADVTNADSFRVLQL